MTDDRRTKPGATPGEDPREIDQERLGEAALDEMEGYEGVVHPQPATGDQGLSSDAPGRDLHELDDAADVPELRDES
ncbi:hypothetical protein E1262_12340 [Jiangella aurantiaca]|uniref:DUF5709 domain-containing protein n=1 Tax=Jiangella aurantiaca TaxID=2530373 RepID=A0A4R5AF03_9ACTN|nr:hypothetical protein [Jiangella aurantiaca]TDD69434.1 hypothetical protein E1262_12340 [Jiangella aurantiaca]